MYQKFTQEKTKECCSVMKEEKSSGFFAPRKETVGYIMQFAYAYHAEKKLPAHLAGVVLN